MHSTFTFEVYQMICGARLIILAHFHYKYIYIFYKTKGSRVVRHLGKKKKMKKRIVHVNVEVQGEKQFFFFVLSLRLICPRFTEDQQQITWIIFLTPSC
jgi:hypothetical protein